MRSSDSLQSDNRQELRLPPTARFIFVTARNVAKKGVDRRSDIEQILSALVNEIHASDKIYLGRQAIKNNLKSPRIR